MPAPDTLALLGEAYAATGDAKKAATQFALVEKIGDLSEAQGALYDRQRALYYADHDLKPAKSVELARGELKVRHDIYAYDTLAWTLFKAGQLDEAAVNMGQGAEMEHARCVTVVSRRNDRGSARAKRCRTPQFRARPGNQSAISPDSTATSARGVGKIERALRGVKLREKAFLLALFLHEL